MASKYDSIWTELKSKGSVRLAVPKPLQKRVIKGVIHCKDHDLARKIEMNHKCRKEKLTYVCQDSLVTIKLNAYVVIKGIQLGDL